MSKEQIAEYNFPPTHLAGEVIDITNRGLVDQVAWLTVTHGVPVGVHNISVSAIFGAGDNPKFIENIYKVKGEARKGKPTSGCLSPSRFIEMIDRSLLGPALANNLESLVKILSALTFIRAPIKSEFVQDIPPHMLYQDEKTGTYCFQNWSPRGVRDMRLFVESMEKYGCEWPAVTSMNRSGEGSIINPLEGENFSREMNMPFLCIPNYENNPHLDNIGRGSFSIINLGENITLTREGNFHVDHLSWILHDILKQGISFDTSQAHPYGDPYTSHRFPENLFKTEGMNRRSVLLAYLYGYEYEG